MKDASNYHLQTETLDSYGAPLEPPLGASYDNPYKAPTTTTTTITTPTYSTTTTQCACKYHSYIKSYVSTEKPTQSSYFDTPIYYPDKTTSVTAFTTTTTTTIPKLFLKENHGLTGDLSQVVSFQNGVLFKDLEVLNLGSMDPQGVCGEGLGGLRRSQK